MQYNRSLMEMVPKYYEELLESEEILRVEDIEFLTLYQNMEDVLLQFRVSTATWGLPYWENIAGIPTDTSKTDSERRSNIRARLRGAGTVTAQHIQNIAEGYSGGTVEVIEDNANYIVRIKFVDTLGVPTNVEDLQAVLREIIPAHLSIHYDFKYVTYEQVPTTYATYQALTDSEKTYEDLWNGA